MYAVGFLPAAAWYFLSMCLVFALVERKNQTRKKKEYRSAAGSM
jgi:hypothetical protein